MVTVADRQAFHRPLLSTVTQLKINLNLRFSNDTWWSMISATTQLLVFYVTTKLVIIMKLTNGPETKLAAIPEWTNVLEIGNQKLLVD